MNVKTASFNQLQAVKEFYYEVIDAVGGADDSVAWKKDIYPAPDFLLESICCGELFLAEEGGGSSGRWCSIIVSTMHTGRFTGQFGRKKQR